MLQYLYTLPILFTTLLCMIFLTATGEYISLAHKKGFIAAFAGESLIILCEVLTELLDGSAEKFRILHYLSNYIGFVFTPLLLLFFALSIGRFHRAKMVLAGGIVYFAVCNILIFSKQIFFIDAQNIYHRGALFDFYIISYFLAIIYLLYETLRLASKGFWQHRIFAYLLSFSFLFSSILQILESSVNITRFTVVFSLCAYYAYTIELTNLFDKLTGFLNQATYLRKIKGLKEQQTVIILDIDQFKYINDHFGHPYGDQCLRALCRIAKSIFGNHGMCYRIGGDEFAIVLRKNIQAAQLIATFEKQIDAFFREKPHHLQVSIGFAEFESADTYETVVQRADDNMYRIKNQRKALRQSVVDAQ